MKKIKCPHCGEWSEVVGLTTRSRLENSHVGTVEDPWGCESDDSFLYTFEIECPACYHTIWEADKDMEEVQANQPYYLGEIEDRLRDCCETDEEE